MTDFLSDNAAGVHPAALAEIGKANRGRAPAYGRDGVTREAAGLFRRHFGESVEVVLVSTGTAANVIALQSVLTSYEAVIAGDASHLHRDECGALEKFTGCKLLPAPTREGKLTIETVEPLTRDTCMVHRVQPRVLSITQCSEWGTVYTPDEIRGLAAFCRGRGMLLHMDGARLANAAAALNLSLKDASLGAGVDVLSFGGTKNGLLAAEAVVFARPELARHAAFYQKQAMQLASKMRFVAAQFIALLSGELWQQNAEHANAMAALLAKEIEACVDPVVAVQTNALFARLDPDWIARLRQRHDFAVWDTNASIVRWMTSFDTAPDDVRDFAAAIRETRHG